jgi:hypothetical protein
VTWPDSLETCGSSCPTGYVPPASGKGECEKPADSKTSYCLDYYSKASEDLSGTEPIYLRGQYFTGASSGQDLTGKFRLYHTFTLSTLFNPDENAGTLFSTKSLVKNQDDTETPTEFTVELVATGLQITLKDVSQTVTVAIAVGQWHTLDLSVVHTTDPAYTTTVSATLDE